MNANLALAYCNAGCTLLATLCMVSGYRAIRRRETRRHKRFMLLAFTFSALFLAGFVGRYVIFGFAEFTQTGLGRALFMALLISHEALSVPTVALVVGVLILGLTGKYAVHKELAKFAFPLWLFVSLSGLAIFSVLYLVPG